VNASATYRLLLAACVCLILFALVACGGGGGGSTPVTTPNPVPTLSALSPTSATVGSGSVQVTVTGTGFIWSSTVQWNGSAKTTTYVGATQLQITLAASDLATAGVAQVTVSNPSPGGGASSSVAFTINNPAPVLNSLIPASGIAGSGPNTIIVSGTGFVPSSVVQWNGSSRSTTFVSATRLWVALTAADVASAGSSQITVTNAGPGGGTSSGVTFTVNNPLPFLNWIDPPWATAGNSGVTVTLNGSGFVSGSVVQWNGNSRPTTFVSATQLQVALTAADTATAGSSQVTVTNGGPGGGTSAGVTFTINNPAPVLTTLNPSSVMAGSGDLTLTVTGSGFVSNSVVQWNGSPRPTTFVTATQLQAALTDADVASGGTTTITVANGSPGGGTSAGATFTVNNPVPVLTAINPVSVLAGGSGLTVTVTGSNFVSGSVVQWNENPRPTTFISATQLQATLTAADVASGANVPISVNNAAPGGGTSASVNFTIINPAPTLQSVTPSQLYVTDSTTLTLSGTGFVPTSVALWNGASRATYFFSATQLHVHLTLTDLAVAGTANVSVSNPAPGGGVSSSISVPVTYALPVLSRVSPNFAYVGSAATTLFVYGSGFAPASVVQWNGVPLPTTYLHSYQMRATIPASDLATEGKADITVQTPAPGGGTSAAVTFSIPTYPVPVITSITPPNIAVNSPDTTVTVAGTGFQPISTVRVNGNDVSTYAAGGLIAKIPASYFLTAPSTLAITVFTPPPGGGTSNTVSLPVVIPPAPVLTSISPASGAAGGGDLTLTALGSNFATSSVVRWNGSPRPTTFVTDGQITATISGTDIATLTSATVDVYTPAPGGGTSAGLQFNTYLPLPANDLIYSPVTQLLYASVPSSAGTTLGNSVISIDPNTGVLGTPIWVGSEPNKLAVSSDGHTLWVGLDGAGAVRQVNLDTQTAGLQFGLGGITGVYNAPNTAASIAAMPGSSSTVAVAGQNSGIWWYGGVVIYDSGVPRANMYGNGGALMEVNGIAFAPSGSALYAIGNGYAVLTVDATGISSSATKNASISATGLVYDSGKVYLPMGVVLDAVSGAQVGVFSSGSSTGPIAVDSVIGRAYVLGGSGNDYQVTAFDLATYVPVGAMPVGYVMETNSGYPASLVRWGQDGLAFRTGTRIYIMRSKLVRDLSTSLADVAVAVSAPASMTTGSDITYNISVSNAGPVSATPATLTDNLPTGAVLKSVTASQGVCDGIAVVICDLGNLNASATATVQITATLLSSGTATNTVTVSAPQGDPDPTNNSVATSTDVSGVAYNPLPVLLSISPEIGAAGSSTFSLTAFGTGFTAGSTLDWNGTALPTSFVNSSQLTAQVDSAYVTSLGWSWVSVGNPTPGGGQSSSLPFTIFKTINLTANHIIFDPFTRKIYATIPSTATEVTGNTVVAIDPYSGSQTSTPYIGSEPNKLAESDDGKYLYIGLDGSKSLTRIDLTSMTQSGTYPLRFSDYGTPTTSAARDLAVMPGNHDTLAVDTGSWSGIGILDISGATATFRSQLTGPYTGSSLVFANPSTLYSYDVDTSGATFNRWTVGANGLVEIDESTLFGIGGFSGAFKLTDGVVYGAAGGVANPATTPPTQMGMCQVANAAGNSQTIQSSGVMPDPAIGRVFYGGTIAGTAGLTLLSCDSNRFVLVDMIQLPDTPLMPTDLIRWGKDGLAFRMAWQYGNSSTIILMRGPRILPQWWTLNPTPALASTSPASANSGTGNLILTVNGSNFVPGAVLQWNGAERTTTFVSSTQLTAAIPAADLVSAGTATLTVVNPGTGASASLAFAIN
jgi:uncharacterized repeat protein (TIGR01451 family)